MTTVAQFALRCTKAPAVLQAAQAAAVRAAALTVTVAVRAELASATHGSNRLRNVGKKGTKLGAGFNMKGATTNPSATIQARGPWQFVERDTKAHTITPKRRGGRALRNAAARGERATNRAAVVIPGVGPRASVKHPGTRGKHPWERGVNASIPAARSNFAAEMERGIVKAVRG